MKLVFKQFSVLAISASLIACVGGDSSDENEFDFLGMMSNYADNIILPAISNLESSSDGFSNQLSSYCDAIDTPEEDARLLDAQQAYLELMGHWQFMEMAWLGPLAEQNFALRNRIYSYSEVNVSACPIDQAVVLAQGDNFDISNRALNHRGLGTLEYLLFNPDLTHQCPDRILETQNWDDLPEDVRKQQRCEYAQVVLEDVESSFSNLSNEWNSDEGNFRSRFVNPNNIELALQGLTEAIFYIEDVVKDIKLGRTLGLQNACSSTTCPEYIESSFANESYFYIQQNIIAFQTFFNGGDELGFDDLIINQGFPEVTSDFQENIIQALDILDNTSESFSNEVALIDSEADAQECENLSSNPDVIGEFPSCNLHGVLTRITNDLKSDFIMIVNIDLPNRAQSDND